ncbi:hypothetical protein CRG98_029104 [Punica granatum]|uniref:Uncharacterized protein n=1 Tax=Punica granatum TaxID=22663 RepID=A0A2I0J2N6_PUNGR|nr:hypothetical protein CRG98_029104 [Punica granatum]
MDESGESSSIREKCETDLEQLLILYRLLMSNGTDSERVKATFKLAKVYCRYLPGDVLSCVIPILVECLRSDPLTDSQKALQIAAVYCLKCIVSHCDVRLADEIGCSGAIEHMLRLIPVVSDDTFRLILVKCLLVLVSLGDECRVILARIGGLSEVIGMLISIRSDVRLEQYLLEILSAVAMLKEVRKELVRAGGLSHLIRATSRGTMASRVRASQVIGLLGVPKSMRRAFAKRGAIPALIKLFHTGDMETKLVAANSLGLISAHTESIRLAGRAGAVDVFAELLAGTEAQGRDIAEDAFCVLAVAEQNAIDIADHMVKVLREGDDETRAVAADVLWDIVIYRHRAPVMLNSGAIPILVQLLRDRGVQPEARERVCALVSRMCYEKRDRDAIADIGAIPLLADIVDHDESEDVKECALEGLLCLYEDPDYHDKVSAAIDVTKLRHVEDLLAEIRKSDELMHRSSRWVHRYRWDPDLI